MEPAKVYFTDFRTQAFGDGLPTKLKKLVRRAGIAGLDLDGSSWPSSCTSASWAT